MPNSKQDEFYIGWQEKMPAAHRKSIRIVVGILIVIFPFLAWLLVSQQQGFVNSSFEFGKQTILEGTLVKTPVPMLRIEEDGQFQHLLLIDFGKRGLAKLLPALEEKWKQDLDQKRVRLRGTLIYYDGKTLLELTDQLDALEEILGPDDKKSTPFSIGATTLQGEIIDPKCFFGAMKPGFGKPHRSCAALCLKGGIPAVLAVENKKGEHYYCLVLGEEGELINNDLLQMIGESVEMKGKLMQMEDWYVLYTQAKTTRQLSFGFLPPAKMCR